MKSKQRYQSTVLTLAIAATLGLSGCDNSSGFDEASAGGGSDQEQDPVVIDVPIAYIERPTPRDEEGEIVADDVLDPSAFKPGARLVLRTRASVTAEPQVLTDLTFADPEAGPDSPAPLYDVKDLTSSDDGTRLLFSMRAPEDPDLDEDEQAKWNIWEYDRTTNSLRRIIVSDLVAEAGHDVDPYYLSDGRIVFSSTRQPRSRAILLDENKPQFNPLTEDRDQEAFVLHTMDEDGTNIRQITFNQSHDLAPTVTNDGNIVFLRWDNYVGANQNRLSLYKVRPDGSDLTLLYGYHSQDTGTDNSEAAFIDPTEGPDGRILAGLRLRQSMLQGGDITYIDTDNFTEIDQTVENSAISGPAQQSASAGTIFTNDTVSPRGYFSTVYPLFDGTNRLLGSWSSCLVEGVALGVYLNTNGELVNGSGEFVDSDGNPIADGINPVIPDAEDIGTYPCVGASQALDQIAASQPNYGIWLFDPINETQSPVVLAADDTMFTEAVLMEIRDPADFFIPEPTSDAQQALIDGNFGVIHIRSVYDFHGLDNTTSGIEAMADPLLTAVDQRPARFLRLLKAVSMPDEDVYDFDNSAFGRAGGQMKDILGYVPVEPDGSAKFIVPADVAFSFSILDANGRRVPGYLGDRHRNWLTVRPGETKECGGCHTEGNTLPHGRIGAEASSSWAGAAGGAPFPNTVLLDEFDTPQPPPENGESMAEYYARTVGPRLPSVNIEFVDEWSDESIIAKAPSYDLSYNDLPANAEAPTATGCLSNWNALCRIVINYIDHIQPIWEADRQVFDDSDPTLVIEDRTCTTCHSAADAMGQAQVPAGQLELTPQQSDAQNDFFTSYAELFFNDIPQEVVDGVLVDETEQATDADGNLLFVTDDEGNLVLDEDGNPIPILVTVAPRPAYLSPAGARNNTAFFNLFVAGASHEDYMNEAELKLLSEWLDIGGQYYNNPFDAPEN